MKKLYRDMTWDEKLAEPSMIEYRELYAKYVTKQDIGTVVLAIGGKNLLNSNDPHFNDIPLVKWDALVPTVMRPGLAKSQCVCILKEAARLWVEEQKAGELAK